MEFDEYGNLFPYKIIEADLVVFEQIFVTNFVKSSNRINLFKQFQLYIEELKQIIGNSFYLWVDGSFITQKTHPADIDVLVFVKNSILSQKKKS